MSLSRPFVTCALLGLGAVLFSGCGDAKPAPDASTSQDQPSPIDLALQDVPSGKSELPLAAIGSNQSPPGQSAAPQPGTAEWIIAEIKRLRGQPFPADITGDAEKLKTAHTERNKELARLATEAVALAHKDAGNEAVFTEAVQLLMEARLQLALQGDRQSIDALYDDASSLYKRDPQSSAAAEAAFALVRFAHTNARRFAREEPRWLEEFARQARIFATSFPKEEARAVPLLHAAGWSCELHGLTQEAIECYTLLKEQYPETPRGKQVDALLRRLTLAGRPLQLAGPTIDGGYISIDDFRGHDVLVVFWATDADRFVELLPELKAIAEKHQSAGLKVIGVNLDAEEPPVDAFLTQYGLGWPQIFYSDPAKRRWENPIARYYGVQDIPMIWLVDARGVVVDTQVMLSEVEQKLAARMSGTAVR